MVLAGSHSHKIPWSNLIHPSLHSYPIEYIDWGEYKYAYEFAAKWRVIELTDDHRPKAIFFNNAVRSW